MNCPEFIDQKSLFDRRDNVMITNIKIIKIKNNN